MIYFKILMYAQTLVTTRWHKLVCDCFNIPTFLNPFRPIHTHTFFPQQIGTKFQFFFTCMHRVQSLKLIYFYDIYYIFVFFQQMYFVPILPINASFLFCIHAHMKFYIIGVNTSSPLKISQGFFNKKIGNLIYIYMAKKFPLKNH